MVREQEIRVVVVGGSIAGLSCAHALLQTGFCSVVVLERAGAAVTAAGAGLALDPDACAALADWGLQDVLSAQSLPLDSEQNRAIDTVTKEVRLLTKDESFRHRALHWSDLHRMLLQALPAGLVRYGHEVVSFSELNLQEISVEVVVDGYSGELQKYECNLLVAADGSMSQTRQRFLPQDERLYRGYSAWRGVLDCSGEGVAQVAASIKEAYPALGHCLYFELAPGTHSVLYMLPDQRLNWLWYVNQPQPDLKGKSVTAKADEDQISQMHQEAERTWLPELAAVMRSTAAPFVNAIFDKEPLKQFVWGRVVLVGEAAHPTSPHGVRSTNMSILDASALGRSLRQRGSSHVDEALKEYEQARLGVTAQQVLFSRHLGKLKQGFLNAPQGSFPWLHADEETCSQLMMQRNMHSFQLSYASTCVEKTEENVAMPTSS